MDEKYKERLVNICFWVRQITKLDVKFRQDNIKGYYILYNGNISYLTDNRMLEEFNELDLVIYFSMLFDKSFGNGSDYITRLDKNV